MKIQNLDCERGKILKIVILNASQYNDFIIETNLFLFITDKNVARYPDRAAKMFPSRNANKFPVKSARKSPNKNVVKSLVRSVKMSPVKSAKMCQNKNAPKYLKRTAHPSTFVKYVNSPLISAEGNDSAHYTAHYHRFFTYILYYAAITLSQHPQHHPGSMY